MRVYMSFSYRRHHVYTIFIDLLLYVCVCVCVCNGDREELEFLRKGPTDALNSGEVKLHQIVHTRRYQSPKYAGFLKSIYLEYSLENG